MLQFREQKWSNPVNNHPPNLEFKILPASQIIQAFSEDEEDARDDLLLVFRIRKDLAILNPDPVALK